MSLLRQSRGQRFRGVVAALEMVDPGRPHHAIRYNERLLAGIAERANELGFKLERFQIGPHGLRINRLDTVLHARGLQALVLLPASGFPDFSGLSWTRYTAVYADYFIDSPPLHCICSDHYRSMIALLQELHARGYRRPGLFMEHHLDHRLQFRWEGAFLAMQSCQPGMEAVPPLHVESLSRESFDAWFKRHNPDVVLGHYPEAMAWMRAAGADIPGTHGFVCLNALRTEGDCAALDLQAHELGARAAELVVGQLLHNEFGVPTEPSLTTIPARLVEGPSLRPKANPESPTTPRRATRVPLVS
jgi:LacI family transcriptional regulator